MPRDGAIIFGDLIGKLDVLRIGNASGRLSRCGSHLKNVRAKSPVRDSP